MHLTRRTFISSSLAAGLVTAAEATESRWLLGSTDPIRVGIVELDASNAEHLALFSAIPGATITDIFGINSKTTEESVAHIQEYRKPTPTIHRHLDSILRNSSINMISISGHDTAELSLINRIVSAGLPVMADIPLRATRPDKRHFIDALPLMKTPVLFRKDYFSGPATMQDVRNWLLRSRAKETEATLTVPICAGRSQMFIAGTISLVALLEGCDIEANSLPDWFDSEHSEIRVARGIPSGTIPIPNNPYGIRHLQIRSLGGNPAISTLALNTPLRSLQIPITNSANPQGSLQTAMRFLNRVRFRREVDNSDSAQTAISLLLMQLFRERALMSDRIGRL